MKPHLSFVVCCFAMFSSTTLFGDWPQYRGDLGDGESRETISNIDWNAQAPKILWNAPTPLGFSSFSISAGRAYTLIAEEADGKKVEKCLALDANTGKMLWSQPLGESDYGHDGGNSGASDNRGGDGPRSTPTTDGKHVFVYDAHLLLTCFDAANGRVVWRHDIVNEYSGRNIKWLNAISPLLHGEVVYVAGGGEGQSFLAFDKNDGALVWKSGDELITHATPRMALIDDVRQIIFFVQSGLVSVNAATGQEIWRTKFPFSVSTAASPVADGNRVYCSAGYGVGAGLFEANGKPEAERVWFKPNELMNHWSTPVLHEGHLYGIFEFKKYGKAPLQCVDLATGEIKWSERGFGPGNCILVGDKLVVLSDAGDVVLVDAKANAYHELGRVQALKGKCWSTPAYSDGRIYVRSTEEAACLVVD
ncbi:MAG: PQQ-binding-like beta-propeller repeat protein [Planctomycetales bacterium]|nr:PQQ-binding-like beta-propeller repeat protein [Planctomycetales bacterium]